MKINDETKVYFTSPASTGKNTESHPAQNGAPPPLKTILVPVEDLSQTAKKASCYAIPFARQMNARIILLHILPVTDAPAWRYDGVNHEWFFDIRGQSDLEHKLAAFARTAFPPDVRVDVEVRYGAPTKKIVNTADELDVDLIIMCTHARRGWVHLLIGSVASDVVRRAPCPVLVVREHEHEFIFDEPAVLKTA
jgi:universal stress protein A